VAGKEIVAAQQRAGGGLSTRGACSEAERLSCSCKNRSEETN